jgi:4-hydroxy-4-methyl-2-oxoglutarate aldolase
MSEDELAALHERYSALYTGAITDVLDRRGLMQQTLPSQLRPLRAGMRVAGPAFPTLGRPHPGHDYDTSIRRMLTMLGAVPAEHVVVYQTNDATSAHLGELSVTSLTARGCRGAVIDGGCRDVDYILQQDFPVFTRHTTPQDCTPRWELIDFDVPVVIGGVQVSPGDYIVGDRDAIVVVPGDLRVEVLEEAEAVVSTEGVIRDAVREGMLPLEAYDRYGMF